MLIVVEITGFSELVVLPQSCDGLDTIVIGDIT